MTAKEAYKLIKKEFPEKVAKTCAEFDDFYAFCMVPRDMVDIEDLITGTVLDTVDKITGEISTYDAFSDIEAFDRSKVIEIETLL